MKIQSFVIFCETLFPKTNNLRDGQVRVGLDEVQERGDASETSWESKLATGSSTEGHNTDLTTLELEWATGVTTASTASSLSRDTDGGSNNNVSSIDGGASSIGDDWGGHPTDNGGGGAWGIRGSAEARNGGGHTGEGVAGLGAGWHEDGLDGVGESNGGVQVDGRDIVVQVAWGPLGMVDNAAGQDGLTDLGGFNNGTVVGSHDDLNVGNAEK
jgi:hypothetical protein